MAYKLAAVFFVLGAVLSPSVVIAEDQLLFGTLPVAKDAKPRRVLFLEVSAYTSRPEETDSTPFITASGTHVRDGIIAANGLRFGTRVRLPDLFGEKVFIVEDRMNQRYENHVDIWMDDLSEAKKLGRRRTKIEVF